MNGKKKNITTLHDTKLPSSEFLIPTSSLNHRKIKGRSYGSRVYVVRSEYGTVSVEEVTNTQKTPLLKMLNQPSPSSAFWFSHKKALARDRFSPIGRGAARERQLWASAPLLKFPIFGVEPTSIPTKGEYVQKWFSAKTIELVFEFGLDHA